MTNYSIEARSLSVAGVGGHSFWVLRDESGRAIAELHGLATDRQTGRPVPIGTDDDKYSLRVWHYPHDSDYAASVGARATNTSYIREGQPTRTALVAGKNEVLARWNAAVAAKEPLNAMDLDYPAFGVKVLGPTVNSNSTHRTLGEVMGLPVTGFPGVLEPGIRNRMASPEQIQGWRRHGYPVLERPSVAVDGDYVEIGLRRGNASSSEEGPDGRHASLLGTSQATRWSGEALHPQVRAALGPALASRNVDAETTDALCNGIGAHCSQHVRWGSPTHFLVSRDGSRFLVRYGDHLMSEIAWSDALALGMGAGQGMQRQNGSVAATDPVLEASRTRA